MKDAEIGVTCSMHGKEFRPESLQERDNKSDLDVDGGIVINLSETVKTGPGLWLCKLLDLD